MKELNFSKIDKILIERVPEFTPILNEHLSTYGEVLEHVLFGDFTRFVIEQYKDSSEDSKDVLLRSFQLIEDMISDQSNEQLSELASVSFLENLHQSGQDYEDIKDLLGPNSKNQLKQIEKQ